MKIKQTLLIIACICFSLHAYAQIIHNDFYNVNPGVGKGLRFWNSDAYKIHMGNNSEYKYGPVTTFSIKSNMNNFSTRGWTWGVAGETPSVAINTQGHIQTKGWIRSMNRRIFLGENQNLYGDNSSALFWTSNHSSITQMIFRDKEEKIYGRIYGNSDGNNFGLLDGDGNWSYLAVKDTYTVFKVDNSNKMWLFSNGQVDIPSNRDASGSIGSGALEIGNGLRLDNDEIITNNQATLHLNRDNAGDVFIDNTTFRVLADENCVSIGNVSTAASNKYKLFVDKGILTEKVKVAVKSSSDWSDYVFEKDYKFMPIENLEAYVSKNKHLPNVPSAEDMVEGGLDVAKMDAKLLEKIEEAHLYIIELHKELKKNQLDIEQLKSQMKDKH